MRLKTSADYEVKDTYSFDVIATDSTGMADRESLSLVLRTMNFKNIALLLATPIAFSLHSSWSTRLGKFLSLFGALGWVI